MSNSYEFQGKNVAKALEMASAELNLTPEKIKYEVLTYGSTGIFGLVGVKKAKIKVFVEEKKESQNEAPAPQKPSISEEIAAKTEQDGEASSRLEDNEDEIVEFGTQALKRIIDGISADATVKVQQTKEKIFFSVTGGDSGVLIGKRGQTLEAIQYLLEKMINKKTTKKMRIMVDVEGYLEKRKNNLKQLASRMAEKAKKIRKPVTIGQMNAHDRRIVHIHLKDESGIRTQSIGDGYYRKLMIFPKKRGSSKGRNNNTKI
jgi:spoIIIJ-associated protein